MEKKETSLNWKQEKNNNHTVLPGSVKRGIKESQKQQERKSQRCWCGQLILS